MGDWREENRLIFGGFAPLFSKKLILPELAISKIRVQNLLKRAVNLNFQILNDDFSKKMALNEKMFFLT